MTRLATVLTLLAIICFSLFGCDVIFLPNGDDQSKECDTGRHIDENSDGECDACGISVVTRLSIYTINDLHGKFADTDTNPGVDELTGYLSSSVEAEPNTIMISSGDMWQGSSESNLTRGRIMTEWMNSLGFASMTLGNHEYDWGEEAISENRELADFPFLGINVYERATDTRVSYCDASVMIKCGDIDVGIIGAMGDCYNAISSDKTTGIYFKTGAQLSSLVKAEAMRLRELGADFIVYSIHDGNDSGTSSEVNDHTLSSYYDISLSDGYVDLVLEAHTHQQYIQIDSHGVYHVQSGGENRGITHVTVDYNFARDEYSVEPPEFISSDVYSRHEASPVVADLLDKYGDEISKGTEVLGSNVRYRNSTYLTNLVAKLYLEFGASQYGDKYDIVLGGGYLKLRSPYSIAAGDVTYSDLQSILPFDNKIALCSISGRDLLQKFINTDNENYRIAYSAYGKSVKDDIKPNETYYVIVDTYTAYYAPNRLTVVELYDEELYARDLLAEYVKKGQLLFYRE